MRRARILAPLTIAGLLGSALTTFAPPALAASPAPPPAWLQPLQVTPPAAITTTPSKLNQPGGVPCPGVIAYVSRGSDERSSTASQDYAGRNKYYDGVGEEMSPLVNYLAKFYPAANQFRVISNDDGVADTADTRAYPAVGLDPNLLLNGTLPQVFMDSIYSGAQAAIDDLNEIYVRCSSSRIVLIGFSQGAIVNRLAIGSYGTGPAVNGKRLQWQPTTGKVATLLFGDPTWGYFGPAVYGPKFEGDVMRPGAASAKDEKGFARVLYDANVSIPRRELLMPALTTPIWNATSFCHGGDPICQFVHQTGEFAGGFPQHIQYDQIDLLAAATRAVSTLDTAPGGYKAAIAVPAILPEPTTIACLPRQSDIPRAASMAASAPGAPAQTYNSRWVRGGSAGPGGTASAPVTVAAGATGTVTNHSTNNFFYNDALQISTQPPGLPTATTPSLLVYYSRICPAS